MFVYRKVKELAPDAQKSLTERQAAERTQEVLQNREKSRFRVEREKPAADQKRKDGAKMI